MPVTIEIPADLEAVWLSLSEAERAQRLRDALSHQSAAVTSRQARASAERLAALFAQWEDADPTGDAAETERRIAEMEQFKQAINASRLAAGEDPVY